MQRENLDAISRRNNSIGRNSALSRLAKRKTSSQANQTTSLEEKAKILKNIIEEASLANETPTLLKP